MVVAQGARVGEHRAALEALGFGTAPDGTWLRPAAGLKLGEVMGRFAEARMASVERSGIVVVLPSPPVIRVSRHGPWDFETTFPVPRRRAIARAGGSPPFYGLSGDELRAALDGLHEETAHGLRADVATARALADGLAAWSDPETGRPLKSAQRLEALERELDRCLATIDGTLGAYTDVFGRVAADAFATYTAADEVRDAADATRLEDRRIELLRDRLVEIVNEGGRTQRASELRAILAKDFPAMSEGALETALSEADRLRLLDLRSPETGRDWHVGPLGALDVPAVVESAGSPATEEAKPKRAARARGSHDSEILQDFGEKIGGARKDLAGAMRRGGLRAADIGSWTTQERVDLIKKDAVWPAPDYRALIAGGMSVGVAYAIRELRKGIPGKPPASRGATEYVEVVGRLADRLKDARSDGEVAAALEPYAMMRTDDGRWIEGDDRDALEDVVYNRTGRGRGCWRVWDEMQAGIGRLRSVASDRPDRQAWIDRLNGLAVAARWPASEEEIARKVAKRSARPREEPEIRPQLAGLTRNGRDWRGGGDAGVDDFLRAFRFRGGEFGNWLSAEDRRQTFNHAFDGLADLADVLGLPPEVLSLGGRLAVAFGARGNGRGTGAAHYEPGRRVINLTKMTGAGSLAHEFGHALDHAIYLAADPSSAGLHPYASVAGFRGHLQDRSTWDAFQALHRAIDRISSAFDRAPITHDAALAKANGEVETRWRTFESWKAHGLRVMGAILEEKGHGHLTTDLIAQRWEQGWESILDPSASHDVRVVAARQLRHLLEEAVPGRTRRQLASHLRDAVHGMDKFLAHVGAYAAITSKRDELAAMTPERRAALEAGGQFGYRDSAFKQAAERLDKARSKPYWSTPWEMFARAFECYVHDQLKAAGRRSDFLVHGVDAEYWDCDERRHRSPYPLGREREHLNGRFSELLQVLATHAHVFGLVPNDEPKESASPAMKQAMGM